MDNLHDTHNAQRNAPIKAVIFDLGDTILNFGKVNVNRLFREAAKHTYEYLESLDKPVGEFKPYCRRNLWAIRWKFWLSLITRKDFDARELLKKVNQPKGISLSEQQWDQLVWLWYEPLSRRAKVEPDIVETLSRLKQMDLRLGVLSNTFVNDVALERHLAQVGIFDFFDVRLYSYQFPYKKPDRRIFLAAAGKIETPPENIMFVGDRIKADIKPALKLGMTAVLRNAHTNDGKRPPDGTCKIKNLSELPAIIQKINNPST